MNLHAATERANKLNRIQIWVNNGAIQEIRLPKCAKNKISTKGIRVQNEGICVEIALDIAPYKMRSGA